MLFAIAGAAKNCAETHFKSEFFSVDSSRQTIFQRLGMSHLFAEKNNFIK